MRLPQGLENPSDADKAKMQVWRVLELQVRRSDRSRFGLVDP